MILLLFYTDSWYWVYYFFVRKYVCFTLKINLLIKNRGWSEWRHDLGWTVLKYVRVLWQRRWVFSVNTPLVGCKSVISCKLLSTSMIHDKKQFIGAGCQQLLSIRLLGLNWGKSWTIFEKNIFLKLRIYIVKIGNYFFPFSS